jgi:hypothetical protein
MVVRSLGSLTTPQTKEITMTTFADHMRSFTDHLQTTIQERGEALAQVRQATDDVREGAREFLGDVVHEHQAMATELRATLDTHRAERRDRVATLRQHHREELQRMRSDLHHMLGENQTARHDTMQRLRSTFHEAQRELAGDLREASLAWRAFAATR